MVALEQTIEAMNKAFLDFNDKAIASGIGDWEPSLAGDLKLTMERFIEYARDMAQESEVEDEPTPNISARVFEHEDRYPNVDSQSAMSSVTSARNPEQLQSEMCTVVAASLGYETSYQLDADIDVRNVQSSEMDNTQAMQISNLDVSDWLEPVQQNRVELPEPIGIPSPALPSFTASLPLPASYSFQEKSFARRLFRSSLETAYCLMKNPSARDEDILRFCKNTFTWSNKKLCIAKVESLMLKTAQEGLENWTAPQWHLGNAGLHYPRTGFDLGSSPPPGWDAKVFTGPRRLVQVDNPMDDSLSVDDIARLLGFDGEWFDPNDVEQYLRGKGLFLDGHSTFVEVDVDFSVEPSLEANPSTLSSPTNSSQDSLGGPQSPQITDGINHDGPTLQGDGYYWSGEMLDVPDFSSPDIGSLLDPQYSADDKSPSNLDLFSPEIWPTISSTFSASSKRYFDVEKFVRSLSFPMPST